MMVTMELLWVAMRRWERRPKMIAAVRATATMS
jgi:hypothetical protein